MSEHQHKHQPSELTAAEQAAIEQVLAAARPAPPRIDRDRLMFLAGAASVSHEYPPSTPYARNATEGVPYSAGLRYPSRLAWPAATAALAATSLALAIAVFIRPAPPERIVYVPQPADLANAPAAARDVLPEPTNGRRPSTADSRLVSAVHLRPAETQPNYLRTRDVALRLGLDALGNSTLGGGDDTPVLSYRTLLESLSPRQQANQTPPASPQM